MFHRHGRMERQHLPLAHERAPSPTLLHSQACDNQSFLASPMSCYNWLPQSVAYWVVSLFFHILDSYDLFPQYRLHTPAEISKRNHVSRYEVFQRCGLPTDPTDGLWPCLWHTLTLLRWLGREQYNIAVWAQRLRRVQHELPTGLGVLGMDSVKLALSLTKSTPNLAGALAGGVYPTPGFAAWEINVAKFLYWVGVPAIQFTVAIVWVDTWQYFLHRAMHMNKFLYTWLHSRHHRLYVPYAYGALYNHPIEGFMLDTLGTWACISGDWYDSPAGNVVLHLLYDQDSR